MSTTQILVLIVVLLLLLFAISRYFTKQEYRSKGGAPFILYKSDIERIYEAIYNDSIPLEAYGLDDDDKANIEEAFDNIEETIITDFDSKRNLGLLAKSLHSLNDKKEQLKSLEQIADESHNKRLATNALGTLKNEYTIHQKEKNVSDTHNKNLSRTVFNALKQQARINNETKVIDEAKEGIEYESRECHIHKVGNESSSELGYSLSFGSQNEDLRIAKPNRMNEFKELQEKTRKQPMIIPIEQQTENIEIERSVNKERVNEEEGIAEVSKNETINNDDNNEEQNNQLAQQSTEESIYSVDFEGKTEEQENITGGHGLSIYNYGFLEAYIHFKRIEGIRLKKINAQMKENILVVHCTGNYMLVIIPVEQQFDVPFDWRRKEHIDKTSICTSFDIYRSKDRASVEWYIYKDVDGQKDFSVYLYRLQNPKPVSSDFLSDADDSSDSDM